jgi:hypothetical protein
MHFEFRSVGGDELVIVDVELAVWISSTGGLEGNADELLAENTGEHRVSHATILVEDLVDDILRQSAYCGLCM